MIILVRNNNRLFPSSRITNHYSSCVTYRKRKVSAMKPGCQTVSLFLSFSYTVFLFHCSASSVNTCIYTRHIQRQKEWDINWVIKSWHKVRVHSGITLSCPPCNYFVHFFFFPFCFVHSHWAYTDMNYYYYSYYHWCARDKKKLLEWSGT